MSGKVFYQYYGTICANLLMFSYGASLGWISPALEILQSEDSPLPSGPLKIDEIAIIAAISCVGGLITSMISGWIADKIGRKKTLILFNFPYVIGWLLVIFAQNGIYLMASRFLHGIGGGVGYIVVPIFVTEISEDRIRGRLGAMLLLSCNIGVLFAFIIGAFLDYFVVAFCHLIVPLLFFVGVIFVQETPFFLTQHQQHEQAKKSLKYYRGIKEGTKDIDAIQQIESEFEKMVSLIEDSNEGKEGSSKVTLNDFLTKAAIKSMIIGFAMATFDIFSGGYALISYASLIFNEAGSTLSPNVSSIIIAVIQIVGVYISVILVDRTGRKFILITSATICTLGLSMFMAYDYLKNIMKIDVSDFSLIPLISFSIVILCTSFGLSSLPWLVLAELTPVKIKSIAFSIYLSYSWLLLLLTILFLPAAIESLGIFGAFSIFAISCLTAIFFISFYVPETKNRSIEEIQQLMSK